MNFFLAKGATKNLPFVSSVMTFDHPRSHHSEMSHPIRTVHNDDDIRSFTPSIISRSSITTSQAGSTNTEVTQEQIDHIRDAFAVFDKKTTGSITTEQFR